jgi:hypothetical protein
MLEVGLVRAGAQTITAEASGGANGGLVVGGQNSVATSSVRYAS